MDGGPKNFLSPSKVLQDFNDENPPAPGTWRRWYVYPLPQFTVATLIPAYEQQALTGLPDSDFHVQMLSVEIESGEATEDPVSGLMFQLVDGKSNYPHFKDAVPVENIAGDTSILSTQFPSFYPFQQGGLVSANLSRGCLPFVLPDELVIPARAKLIGQLSGNPGIFITVVLHGFKSFPVDPAFRNAQSMVG